MRPLYSSLVLLLVLGVSASLARVHAGGPFSGLYRPSVEVEVPVECERSPEACGGSGVHVSAMAPAQARNASRVNGIGNYTSYAGFTTVRPETHNNLFWWYFPPQSGASDAPIIIWLQGGPGGSSLFGLFAEMGPFSATANQTLQGRNTTWNKDYGMIFIDNPVGAGFSYTLEDAGYCTNETEVADQLYSMLTQFYAMFPELLTNDLYVAGESYGGHYVPAFAYKIHQANQGGKQAQQQQRAKHAPQWPAGSVGDVAQTGGVVINMKGVSIGDGWVDPLHMVPAYADQMYNVGMADANQAAIIRGYTQRIVAAIESGDRLTAFHVWDEMINGDVYPYPNYFHNITGSNDYDNMARTNNPVQFSYFYAYVTQPSVRKAIHVGDRPFNSGHECEMHLLKDFMVSLAPQLSVLMDNYKVLLYSGQFDIIIGPPLTELMLQHLQWSGSAAYKTAARDVWRVSPSDERVAGYVRQVGNFTQVIVRDAGHIVPADQGRAALDMINHFVQGKPYTNRVDPSKSSSSSSKVEL